MAIISGPQVAAEDLKRFVEDVLLKLDVPDDEARIVADVLVTADLRGVSSHGVGRLHYYVDALAKGLITRPARITMRAEWPALAYIDGGGSLGQVVGYRAMQKCLDMAERAGAACVTVANSKHFGIAAYYAMMAPPRGMIGISLTNSRPHVPPTFGRKAVLGTNPIAMAVPAGRERPWVLDMATSTIPLGKVEVAQRAGRPLPLGTAFDADGQLTTDPSAVERGGSLSPLGGGAETAGYKGYGLSVLVDILCGVLSGSGYCALFRPGWAESETSHFFAALRIDAVRPAGDFEAMMEAMIRDLRATPKAAGQTRVLVHGEPEYEAEEAQRRNGVALQPKVTQELREMALRYGVRELAMRDS